MFALEDLLAAPVPLGQPLGRRPHKLLTNILTRKPHRFIPPNIPELRIPADGEARELIDVMLADIDASGGEDGLRALRAAIERPQVRAAGRGLGAGVRDYDIGAAVAGADQERWRFVALSVRVRSEKGRTNLEGIRCRLLSLEDTDALRHEFTSIYQGAEGRQKLVRPDRPSAIWLRGKGAQGLPTDWAGEVEGLAATFGFRLHVLREPDVGPADARAKIERIDPALVLLWDYDGRATELGARASLDSLGMTIERIEGDWDNAMLEASQMLARHRNIAPPKIARPRTVADAVSQARTHPNVEILPAARRSAGASPFRRPLDVVIALNDVVTAVETQAFSAPGGLPRALEASSFRYASGVSATARQSGEYDRTYEGRTVILGPHLKLGAGSPEHCLRIYWYVDEAKQKVVIGHIGEHLPDAGS